ncbi:MAG: 4'-phosphopantetheinyl transferase superfamily protein [Oscillospiraceae bacterium]|nr:4'-phosphopantetheinyl transferase superfamily protein [Oscillospiraceae bacterium]
MPNDNSMHSHDRLLHCASLYSGLPPSAFCREQQPNGKPVLKGGPDLHFSVSHSGKWWVCAFGPQEVGLDVQKNRPCRAQALAKRFFHPDEAAYLQSKDFSLQEFYRLWTAKESYVKLSGRGFGKGFSTFSLIPQPVGPQWRYLSLEQNYTLCLCAEQIDQVVIKHLTINDGGTLF